MGPFLSGAAPGIRFNTASAVVVFHGNSLVSGAYATQPMPYQVQRLAPVRNALTCINYGQPGLTWSQLRTQGATVDGYYDAGKTNILVLWEGTNTLRQGASAATCYANSQAYTADRLAARPGWKIVHMTTIPARYSASTDAVAAEYNARINAYNASLRAGAIAGGAVALVDLGQVGSPFVLHPDYTVDSFNAIKFNGSSVWTPSEPGQFVHITDGGYTSVAQMVAATLRKLPKG